MLKRLHENGLRGSLPYLCGLSALLLACGGGDGGSGNGGPGGGGDGDGGTAGGSDAGQVRPIPVGTIAELGTPFDVNRNDLVGPSAHAAQYGKPPEIVPLPAGTGIDVLWQDRSDENNAKAFLVHLAPDGDDFVMTRALEVPMLDRIMGLAKDPEGNHYVASGIIENLHQELTVEYPAVGEFRTDVGSLIKINSEGQQLFDIDIDIARSTAFDGPEAMINPMVAASSRLAYGNGSLALVHGINTDPDSGGVRHQKALTTHFDATSGEVTKASSMWVSHSFDQRVFHDGQGFIEMHLGDAYPRTIAFGRVTPDSGTRHLYHIKGNLGANNTRTRLGNAVMLEGHGDWGYMALISTERTTGTDAVGSHNKIAGARDLALIRVRGAFQDDPGSAMDHVDQSFGDTQTVDSSGSSRTNYVRWMTSYHVDSPGAMHAERPKMVALGNDRFLILWEQWSLKNENNQVTFDATYGMVVDGSGAVIEAATQLTDSHLPRGDDAIGVDGRAIWVTGDEETKALHVHLVGADLGYRRAIVE